MNKTCIALITLIGLATFANGQTLIAENFIGNAFNDRQGWSVQHEYNPNSPIITDCAGTKIFGGYNKFGARTNALKLFPLPPHHTIRVLAQFWKIDSWDNEHFQMWADDALLHTQQYSMQQGNQNKCGRREGGWNEFVQNYAVNSVHTGPTVVIAFASTLNQAANDESWAIRNFQLLVYKCPEGCSACTNKESQESCLAWYPAYSSWTKFNFNQVGPEGWNVSGGNPRSSQCGPCPLFGGYNLMGSGTVIQRTFNLPPHYRLRIKTMLAKIDSWDLEKFLLFVDNQKVYERPFHAHFGYAGGVCGRQDSQTFADIFVRIEVELGHTGPTAFVQAKNTLNQGHNDESLGVRDFYLFVAKCAPNCAECNGPKPANCQRCQNNWVVQNGECRPLANFVLLEQSFMQNQFTGVSGWTLKNNVGGKTVGSCQGVAMVGGYGIFGKGASAEKVFLIPSHSRLRLKVTVYKIDSWDNEWFFLRVDGTDLWKAQWNTQTGGRNICGSGSWPDAVFHHDRIFNHDEPKAHILMTSTLNQDANDESWGFREFALFYEPKEACPIFYAECHFKGAAFEFCENSPNFSKDNIPSQIRSIRIPPSGRVTLYENADYKGKKVVYTEDQECIKEFKFEFVEVKKAEDWIQVQEQ